MSKVKIGIVGVGKIARDQHLPALAESDAFELCATASPHSRVDGIEGHASVAEMLAARPEIEAVSLCTPPEGRFEQAMTVLQAGKHLMLEKPPAATISEAETLRQLAREKGLALFATWHSREAAEVDAAHQWLAGKRIEAVRIRWKEDIRHWHPGQDWILAAGGFGVFDPGINALSIATRILPEPLVVTGAVLSIPKNRISPIAATITLQSGDAPVDAQFDFLQIGEQTWDIEVDTVVGQLRLRNGGGRLELPGAAPLCGPNREYLRLYRRFAQLVRQREIDADLRPMQLVADAFLVGQREEAAPFAF
ncbi:Gfo/Idh/MocA family oxidoreductase [Caulobacter sp. 73W]|uniref:Gfo/Idh/MocA family oxidoreductase n=1 Tax=Caulobacter sp. 73W TaxID=3161137 RepID=A0AB39KYX1_9CAUL